MQFKYLFYLVFISLFACEHHSSNINIKNKPENSKSETNIHKSVDVKKKFDKNKIINIIYSNKGFALIYDENKNLFLDNELDNSSVKILSPNLPNGTPVRITNRPPCPCRCCCRKTRDIWVMSASAYAEKYQ